MRVVQVSADGQNSIIVILGANDLLTPADVASADGIIKAAKVVVCQHEVPIETTIAALRAADAAGVTSIFNPAPAQVRLSRCCLQSLPQAHERLRADGYCFEDCILEPTLFEGAHARTHAIMHARTHARTRSAVQCNGIH
jgi:hypothetical protein